MPPSQCVSWRQNAMLRGSCLDVRGERRAGRGEAGHALEVRVERPAELGIAGEDERQRAEERHAAAR